MVKLLSPTDIDPIMEQVEEVMDTAEEEAASKKFAFTPDPGDLSDGGMVGGVRVRPNRDKTITTGRPAARLAWMWNGTETVLPLAWNPEGNRHDGARHYLLKRYCLCCHAGGFFGRQCKACVKNNCANCRAGTDTTTEHRLDNGKTIKGWIIPNFYLRKGDVPFQAIFYGNIDCFLPSCPRRGQMGFLDEQAMWVHGAKKHRDEYKARMDTQAMSNKGQVEVLQKRVDDLMLRLATQAQIQPVAIQAAPQTPAEKRKATWAAKKQRAAGGVA